MRYLLVIFLTGALIYSGGIAGQSTTLPATLDHVNHNYPEIDIITPNSITMTNCSISGRNMAFNSSTALLSATTIIVHRLEFSNAVHIISIGGTTRISCVNVDFGTAAITIQRAGLPSLPTGPVRLIIEYSGSITQGNLNPLDGVDLTIVKK